MKALEILKDRYKELSFFSETQREASPKLALVLVEMVKINEAISELEALQQHIKDLESQLSINPLQLTCVGCEHQYSMKPESMVACGNCSCGRKYNFKKDTK